MPLPANRKNERFFLRKVREGRYSVSKNGTVRNEKTGRVIDSVNRLGYICVVCKDKYGKARHILAHRLVWLVLKGDIPDGIQINHKNGIKSDNRPRNLELVTNSENVQHSYDTELVDLTKKKKASKKAGSKFKDLYAGENGTNAILLDSQVRKVRKWYSTGNYTQQALADFYKVSREAIRDIVNYKTFRHI